MAGQIICVICCQRYDFITICEQSKFATLKQRKGFFLKTKTWLEFLFCCAENADDVRAFAIKKRTLHLTLLVECSVLNFIRTEFRFIVVVKFNWLSRGETALKNDLDKLKKVSARRF